MPPIADQLPNVCRRSKEEKIAPLVKTYVQTSILVHSRKEKKIKTYEDKALVEGFDKYNYYIDALLTSEEVFLPPLRQLQDQAP